LWIAAGQAAAKHSSITASKTELMKHSQSDRGRKIPRGRICTQEGDAFKLIPREAGRAIARIFS